jgi:hypothetical protein
MKIVPGNIVATAILVAFIGLAGCAGIGSIKERSMIGGPESAHSFEGSIAEGTIVRAPGDKRFAREAFPSGSGIVEICDSLGRVLLSIKAQPSPNDLKGLAWSPDGSVLAVMYHGGSLPGILLYDSRKGILLRYLPFHTHYHAFSFSPDSTMLYLAETPVSPVQTIALRDTSFALQSGVNLPWLNYGWDIGRNPWGGSHGGFSSQKERLFKEFSFLATHGGKIARVFIFCDARSAIRFSADGMPIGFDRYVERDFNTLLKVASSTGIRLIPVLLDYTLADGVAEENNTFVGEHPDLIQNPLKRAALAKLLASFVLKWKGHKAIWAWDLMNEPEHLSAVSPEEADTFLSLLAEEIRKKDSSSKITLGALFRKNFQRWASLPLHFRQFHYYNLPGDFPFDYPAGALGDESPILVGEVSADDLISSCESAWRGGYAGILFWHLNLPSFRENAELFRTWLSVH